jgi:molecular chaperone GrpE
MTKKHKEGHGHHEHEHDYEWGEQPEKKHGRSSSADMMSALHKDVVVDTEHPESDLIVELQAKVEEAEARSKEQLLRAHAEFENLRKRLTQDVEKTRKFANENFAAEMLPVVDTLEKGLESTASAAEESESVQAMAKGMQLTLDLLLKTLEKFGVVQVNPLDQPFNPEFHQAMSMQEDPDAEPNTVVQVFQKGYLLNGRLLRPALVVVSK